jgi:hypothetical protein
MRPLLIIKDKGIPNFPNRSRDKTANGLSNTPKLLKSKPKQFIKYTLLHWKAIQGLLSDEDTFTL